MAERVSSLTHLSLRSLSASNQPPPEQLKQLSDNLTLLRKIANDYPMGTFHFISYVIDSEKWYLLDLLESRPEYDYGCKSFSLGDLLENAPANVEVDHTVLERIDMIYALTGLLDIQSVYGCYESLNPDMWKEYEEILSRVNKCVDNRRPFCFVDFPKEVARARENCVGIKVIQVSTYEMLMFRHLTRLHHMLMCYTKDVMELHKVPDGSPFPVRDGEAFIREMISRFHSEPEALPGVRRYYYQSILRKMGLSPDYAGVFMSYVAPSDACPEEFTEVLSKVREQFSIVEAGGESNWNVGFFVSLVAAEFPEKISALFAMGVRVHQPVNLRIYRLEIKGGWNEDWCRWGECLHHDRMALALVDMATREELR